MCIRDSFYTARQISMTFLGKPRTQLAEHAHESSPFMTIPLVLLSLFAVTVGWSGISDRFLGTDGIFYNFFHHYAGAEYYHLMEELYERGLVAHTFEPLPWSWAVSYTHLDVYKRQTPSSPATCGWKYICRHENRKTVRTS